MYYTREIEKELSKWQNDAHKKPLLLRGARQVGKSSLVRNFSKRFTNYIEVNFELSPAVTQIFEKDLDPKRICEELSVLYTATIQPGKTLLFLDEIQECPNAISSLRFFYEKMPELHVIAAGSLLEFALEKLQSYGVGRIRSIYLYPFSFNEFLEATGNSMLKHAIEDAAPLSHFSEALHGKAIELFKRFLIIGGMPEVIVTYCRSNDILKCQQVLDDILISYEDDFSKYKKRISGFIVHEVFKSTAQQVGAKYMYSKSIPELNNLQVKEGLRLLMMAGLVYPVTHSSSNGVPLGSQINIKFRKYIVFDTGIYQRMLKLHLPDVLLHNSSDLQNIGVISEMFVGLEIIKRGYCYEKQELFYWQRQAKNSQAEIDYVIQKDNTILPIEVKSGRTGKMQSLFLFLKEKNLEKGVRTSLENFSSYSKIDVYPLYAIGNVLV